MSNLNALRWLKDPKNHGGNIFVGACVTIVLAGCVYLFADARPARRSGTGSAAPVAENSQPQTGAADSTTATAVFAGGCFWCTEAAFEELKGVLATESGYAGGKAATANYEQVSHGNTGHAECIRVTYDPRQITYDQLLDVFFDSHIPTQRNRQGNDVGTQYRSAIFFANPEQEQAAEAKIRQLTKAKVYSRPIVTTLEPLKEFYPAETYHQDYARKNPYDPYIQALAVPKSVKIRKIYPSLVKPKK